MPYFFLAAVLAIAAAYLITNIVFDTVEERFRNQLAEVGQLLSELMVKEEDRLLEAIRLMSNSDGLAQAMLRKDPEALRTLSLGIAVNAQLDDVEFLDTHGYPMLALRHNDGGLLEDYSFSSGGNNNTYQSWDFVEKVLQNQVDDLGDKYSGYMQADWGNYFYVSGPVYDKQNKFAGVILVGTSLEKLATTIHEKSLGQITFYNFEGIPVSTSFIFDPPPLDSPTASQVLANQSLPQSSVRSVSDQRDLSVVDITYTEVLAAWEARGDVDLGIMGAALVKNFFVNPSNFTRFQMVGLVGLALFMVILVGINLANLITRPLLGLVKVSQLVAAGDLDVHLDMETNDEINTLVNSFNQMITNLSQSRDELLQAYDSALIGWSKALELRDKDTEGHTQRVVDMTVALSTKMGLKGEELVNIRRGATLHDIGKMGISDTILHKPGRLTSEEWEKVQLHPQYAYDMLKDISFLVPALDIPRYHHENWDGSGYPYGLKGNDIPLAARIFSVIDTWDALISERPYKPKYPIERSLRLILADSGKKFDPAILKVFFRFMKEKLLSKED
ncbi:MAG: HD domain-containing phosphohydrolase [Chloroflexota bacterium]